MNAKQHLTVIRGTTNNFSVVVTDENGDIYTLESGEILRFGVKRKPEDSQYIFRKEVTEKNEEDEYAFSINVSDTENLSFGEYYYDIGLQSGDQYYNIIPTSEFIVARNITKWES